MSTVGTGLTLRVLLLAQLRQQPARLIIMLAVIAIGVALGTAVFIVNATALNEFTLATKRLVGEADIVVRGPQSGFTESVFPMLASNPAVRVASPILEIQAAVPGRQLPLKIVGLDVFRATALQPALLGELSGDIRRLFDPRGVFLSARAATELSLKPHDDLTVIVGSTPVPLEVLGILSAGSYPQAIGVMDIASAQWTFQHLGRLSRIDLQLNAGVDTQRFITQLGQQLPHGVLAIAPEVERDRAVTVTRAYRVNLNMLALVSLFTSAFLVFSIQSLSMLRRRASIALLRALGVTRGQLERALLAEGAVIGILGSAVGVLVGVSLATAVVRLLNGDFGNGQLQVSSGRPLLQQAVLIGAFLIGSLFGCLGAWFPAREAAMRSPARGLKAGDAEMMLNSRRLLVPGALLIALGLGLLLLPPQHGVPIAGYGSIAALLFGSILWVPRYTQAVLGVAPRTRRVVVDTALAQLNGSHGTLFLSLAPIIVSFSLMVSMAIMVHSFRDSFEVWLTKLLPADLQMRLPPGNDTATWSDADQRYIAALPGIVQTDFRRSSYVFLSADREPVTLLARDMQSRLPQDVMPMIAYDASVNRNDALWVSEAAQDKFGYKLGQHVGVAIAGSLQRFIVAGIWRDYAHANGALVISRQRYIDITADRSANEGAVWMAPGANVAQIQSAIRNRFGAASALEMLRSSEVRDRSLLIFDRAFAVTYALEVLAVIIGLAGISVAASFTAITRRMEFGMLRHIGLRRSQVVQMLATEGIATAILGTVYGLALGFALSLVLIFVINRQSFNWSIDLSIPVLQLGIFAAALIVAAAATAVISGRAALGVDVVRAVREDW